MEVTVTFTIWYGDAAATDTLAVIWVLLALVIVAVTWLLLKDNLGAVPKLYPVKTTVVVCPACHESGFMPVTCGVPSPTLRAA